MPTPAVSPPPAGTITLRQLLAKDRRLVVSNRHRRVVRQNLTDCYTVKLGRGPKARCLFLSGWDAARITPATQAKIQAITP